MSMLIFRMRDEIDKEALLIIYDAIWEWHRDIDVAGTAYNWYHGYVIRGECLREWLQYLLSEIYPNDLANYQKERVALESKDTEKIYYPFAGEKKREYISNRIAFIKKQIEIYERIIKLLPHFLKDVKANKWSY